MYRPTFLATPVISLRNFPVSIFETITAIKESICTIFLARGESLFGISQNCFSTRETRKSSYYACIYPNTCCINREKHAYCHCKSIFVYKRTYLSVDTQL